MKRYIFTILTALFINANITFAAAPTTQASNAQSSNLTYNSVTISWTRGNGDHVIVLAAETHYAEGIPDDGTSYNDSSVFGKGDHIDHGRNNSKSDYIVYVGTGTSINVTGLKDDTQYDFIVYEFNGTGSSTEYKTDDNTSNFSTINTPVAPPIPKACDITFSNIKNDKMDISWTSGGGDRRLILVKEGSSIDSNPTDGQDYNVSSTFEGGDEIGTGNYACYDGTGNSFTLSGLSGNTTYYVQVFEYSGSGSNIVYQTTDTTNNPNNQLTLKDAPSSQAYDIIATEKDGNNAKISWEGGNGERCFVYINANNSFTDPADGFDGTANSSFNNSGQQLMYKGTSDNFTVSGLSENTTYYVRAYECNNTGTNTVFLKTAVGNNPKTFLSPYKEPTTQSSNITFSLDTTSITCNLIAGNGTGRIIKINTTNSFTDPIDGSTYSANETFQNSGEQVIYSGSGSTVTVDGLTINTTYYFKAFEYSNDNNDIDYKIDGHLDNSNPNNAKTIKPEPTSQSYDITFTNNNKNSYTVNWVRPSSGNGDAVIVLGKEGAAVSDFPTDGSTYTADNNFGGGSQIGNGNYVLYIGTGTSVNVTSLKEGTYYSVRIFEYNNTGIYTDYLTTSATNNPRSGITQGDALWQGDDANSPENWGIAENWSTNEVPGSSRSVVIPSDASNMPIISSGTQNADDLTIEAGATLTINNGTTLNVNGDALLKSPSSGAGMPGTIIIPGTGVFNADNKSTIERYMPTSKSHFYSSAISSVSVSDMMYYYVGTYSEPNKTWTYLQPGDAMSTLNGYELLKSTNASLKDKLSFTGTFNNGNKSISVTNKSTSDDSYGWNLVGNPYPSTIDWEASGWTRTNVDATVYVYNASTETYTSYTIGDDSHFYIAPMQGFFIHTSSSTGTLGFSNSIRANYSVDFKSNIKEKQKIKIKVSNKHYNTEAAIQFYNDATVNFDSKYDAYKLLGYNDAIPEIYTIIKDSTYIEKNTIQGNALDSIPVTGYDFRLGIKQGSSTVLTISISEINNIPDSLDITLIDKVEQKSVNLKNNDYTFSTQHLNDERFILRLEPHKILVSDINISSDNGSNITYVNDTLLLNANILPMNASNSSILWSVDNENIATINNNGVLVGKVIGSTTVTATATDGSGVIGSYNVIIKNATLIKDINNNIIINIYPNPTSGIITLKSTLNKCQYKIYDNVGRVLIKGNFTYHKTIDLSNINNGVYFIEFIYNNNKQVELLIKK